MTPAKPCHLHRPTLETPQLQNASFPLGRCAAPCTRPQTPAKQAFVLARGKWLVTPCEAKRQGAFAKWSPITCKSCFAVNSVVRVLLDAGPQLVRASVPASGKSCPDAIAGMVQLGSVIVAAAVLWKFVEFSAKLRHCRSAESREFSGSCSCRCRLSDGCRSATVWSLAG